MACTRESWSALLYRAPWSVCPRPHLNTTARTDPDVTWRNDRRCPLVVHCWADLQSVHGFRCYDNIARTRNVSECLYSLYAWFLICSEVRMVQILFRIGYDGEQLSPHVTCRFLWIAVTHNHFSCSDRLTVMRSRLDLSPLHLETVQWVAQFRETVYAKLEISTTFHRSFIRPDLYKKLSYHRQMLKRCAAVQETTRCSLSVEITPTATAA